MRIGGSGEPSSARNRPAGKRDTTGRLHYRAPTCFLSPRRGLSPLRPVSATLLSTPLEEYLASRFSPLHAPADSSIQQRIYKSVSSVSFVPLGSPDPILY